VVGLLLASQPASATAAPPFIGKWRAQSRVSRGKTTPIPKDVKIFIQFRRGGAFFMRTTMNHHGQPATRTERGTWEVKGRTLTIKADRKPETMIYRVKGRILKLTKEKQGQTLVLVRQ
jgi:hypothetical protein